MKRLVDDLEAHVWHVHLDALREGGTRLDACLSTEETERARRIAAPVQRERFIAARAAVRGILAQYTGTTAAAVMLQRTAGGKPLLAGVDAPHFSLTHSAGLAAVAVAAAPVGIDLEHVRELRRARAATRILHPETLALIDALPAAERAEAFIDAWTQREAHVKAVGGGMFRTPDALPFEPWREQAVHLLRGRDGSEWSVLRWSPAHGARAALAVRGTIESVTHMHWTPDTSETHEEG